MHRPRVLQRFLAATLIGLGLWSPAARADDVAYFVLGPELQKRSLESGQVTKVGTLDDNLWRLAFAPDGTLYAIDHGATSTTIFSVDPATAGTTSVARLDGVANARGLAVADDGVLWISAAGVLHGWDPASGDVQTLVPAVAVEELGWHGDLYGLASGHSGGTLQRIDLSTGATEPLFSVLPFIFAEYGAAFDTEGRLWVATIGAVDPPFGDGALVASDLVTEEVVTSFPYFEGARGVAIREECPGLCLRDGRFLVEVEWRDFRGNVGVGRAVPTDQDATGLFWFFEEDNWEMLVKVIDGCSNDGHFWFLAASATNVEYHLRVTDLEAGVTKEYDNPLGREAPAIADNRAFDTCP